MRSQVSKSRLWWERFWKAAKAAAPSRALAFVLILMLLVPAAQTAQAQTLTVLHNFGEGTGADSSANLVLDAHGNLYGTTLLGGAHLSGVVFKLAANNTYRVLYNFTRKADGAYPGSLIRDAKGNLYGTTHEGEFGNYGTVFKLAPSGRLSILYTFTNGPDGGFPGLSVLDAQGNLYGATGQGGIPGPYCPGGCGTIWKIASDGTFKTLYSFLGAPGDGAFAGSMVLDAQGNLYGTTSQGGTQDGGTVFKLTPDGSETVLYDFLGGADGISPSGNLIRDAQGNLHGTTGMGGAFNRGTVFEFTAGGAETVLYSFGAFPSDAVAPGWGVVGDGQGNLYGTTTYGGANNCGAVFKVAPDGTEKVLYSFTGWRKDQQRFPRAGVILDAQGNLYGTTTQGGTFHRGVLYKLTP